MNNSLFQCEAKLMKYKNQGDKLPFVLMRSKTQQNININAMNNSLFQCETKLVKM